METALPSSRASSPKDRSTFRGLTLVAGHAALDLLNTVKYRGKDDPEDKFASMDDIVEWARLVNLLSPGEARKLSREVKVNGSAARVHREICSFREQVRILLEDTNSNSAKYGQAVSDVEAAITGLRATAKIDRKTGNLTRCFPIKSAADLKARIIDAVAGMLTNKADLRIGFCGGFDCDWVFVDRTKAGRRQWCDSRTCGNIARVRRYRKKH